MNMKNGAKKKFDNITKKHEPGVFKKSFVGRNAIDHFLNKAKLSDEILKPNS